MWQVAVTLVIAFIIIVLIIKYIDGDFSTNNSTNSKLKYRIVEITYKGTTLYEIQVSKNELDWKSADICHSFEKAETRINELLFPVEGKVLKYYEKL